MKLVAMLRIKDQILTIDECLARLSQLVDQIVIVDNGSTDGTLEAYARYPKVVSVLQTVDFDEGRDKVMIHEEAKKLAPDWILWIDGDEIFEPGLTRAVLDRYMSSRYDRISFRMCNFWLSRRDCRCDREYFLYTLHPQRSMWRNIPSAYFKNVKIHNGDILGITGPTYISPYRIKHYGYVDKNKVAEKMALYTRVDTNGSRNYNALMNTTIKVRTFRYVEFDNTFLNRAYIIFYKYACNLLWLAFRIYKKIFKIFNIK